MTASPVLFHVTYAFSIDGIREHGLLPGRGQTFSTHASRSSGKVFLTEADGVSFWFSRYEEWAQHYSDDPVREGYIPVVLRVYAVDLELHLDDEGTRDARADAYYTPRGVSIDDLLTVYTGDGQWLLLDEVDSEHFIAAALEQAGASEEPDYDEDEESPVDFDFDYFLPSLDDLEEQANI